MMENYGHMGDIEIDYHMGHLHMCVSVELYQKL